MRSYAHTLEGLPSADGPVKAPSPATLRTYPEVSRLPCAAAPRPSEMCWLLPLPPGAPHLALAAPRLPAVPPAWRGGAWRLVPACLPRPPPPAPRGASLPCPSPASLSPDSPLAPG
eukprot:gene11980-10343_t